MRRLLIWEGVRIHLDQVDGLGRFIELEAVAPPQSDLNDEQAKVARLRSALAISDDRLVALGYAELLYGRLHFGGTAKARRRRSGSALAVPRPRNRLS